MTLKCAIFAGCIWWLSNQYFEERLVAEHEIRIVLKCNIKINFLLYFLDTCKNLVKYLQKVSLGLSINRRYISIKMQEKLI